MRAFELNAGYSAWVGFRRSLMAVCCVFALVLTVSATAQDTSPAQPGIPPQAAQPNAPLPSASNATQNSTQVPSPAPDAAQPPAQSTPAQPSTPAPAENAPAAATPSVQEPAAAPAAPAQAQQANAQAPAPLPGEMTEDELKRMLVGKQLYLRGGYMDNSLSFSEFGKLIGHSPQGSYTLNQIQIDRVRLTKHKVELEGERYGLHFLGALAYEDPATAIDRLKITPKKKTVKITIDREQVITRKVSKESRAKGKEQKGNAATPVQTPPPPTTAQAPPAATEPTDADQLKAEIAATPAAERPADPNSVTATFSAAHATNVLREALSRIFAPGIDEQLIASMPDCWKLYYQAAAANTDYRPKDPAVFRQNAVDKKARLLSSFQPESNEFAQANSVSGMALYHAVIGPDGKPQEIAVGRPIGLGLDENAVESIRKASFEPAMKDGKSVPVLLDLVVQFRIYSKRTAEASKPEDASKRPEPVLPGPYSVQHP
jgi:hypothetical protein